MRSQLLFRRVVRPHWLFPAEPPRQSQPIRHCLGWVLMQQGKLKEAEQVRMSLCNANGLHRHGCAAVYVVQLPSHGYSQAGLLHYQTEAWLTRILLSQTCQTCHSSLTPQSVPGGLRGSPQGLAGECLSHHESCCPVQAARCVTALLLDKLCSVVPALPVAAVLLQGSNLHRSRAWALAPCLQAWHSVVWCGTARSPCGRRRWCCLIRR